MLILWQGLKKFLEAAPTSTLDDMRLWLWDEWEVHASEATISRALSRFDPPWTRKKATKRALQQNPLLQDEYMIQISCFTADMMVFLDKSACNERTGDQRYGWAPIGAPCVSIVPYTRSERWSILPAYTTKGYIAWQVYQGSFNEERFNSFVKDEVLPLTTPFPGKNSVIVLDNAKIHHNDVCLLSKRNIKLS